MFRHLETALLLLSCGAINSSFILRLLEQTEQDIPCKYITLSQE